MNATEAELAYIRERGERLEWAVIEQWRQQTVIRTSALPWQARTWAGSRDTNRWSHRAQPPQAERVKHVYSTRFDPRGDHVILWELLLEPPRESLATWDGPPAARLQLRLEDVSGLLGRTRLQLCALHGRFGCGPIPDEDDPLPQHVLLEVPLDAAKLGPFRRPDVVEDDRSPLDYRATPCLTCYGNWHAPRGHLIHWDLWIHDFEAADEDGKEPFPAKIERGCHPQTGSGDSQP